VTFRTDDGQTAGCFHFLRQLDVGTTTGHVGGDRHRTALTGSRHDFGFFLVQLRVQDIMFDLTHGKHTTQQFGDFDGCRTDQYRASGFGQSDDLFDYGVIFFALCLVDTVVHVVTCDRAVCRDYDNIQFVDIPEFAGFRFSRTGHTGQLVIHTEVVLQGDCRECLCGGFHFHTFFGFDGLVQTVGIAASVHDTARLFVDDHDLVVHHNIFVVFLKQGVSLQQLVDCMYAFALDGIVGQQFVFLGLLFFFVLDMFQFGKLGGDIRQYEECRVVGLAGQQVDTFICQFDTVILFVDHEVQLICSLVHVAHVFGHEVFFRLQHLGFYTLFTQEFDQRLVARISLERTVQLDRTFFHFFRIAACHFFLGFDQQFGAKVFLCVNYDFYIRTELFEQLFFTAGDRAGNDQRCTGIVDQYGVDLIDNGIVVFALYQVVRADRHVVAQVVETEFVVRTECDVGIVGCTAGIGVWLVLVDTVY